MAVDRIRNHQIIIFDTNALFIPFEFKINIDVELKRIMGDYQIIIPKCVFREVQRLSKTERFGKSALHLAKIKAPPSWYDEFEKELLMNISGKPPKYDDNPIDNQILEIAKELNAVILTNDRFFLKILNKNGIRTISLRKKKYLKPNYKI